MNEDNMSYKADVALITPSYAADFERCRLLCDSIDRFVEEQPDHFILVDNDDYLQFTSLSGPKRHIINERDILPSWLKSMRGGFSKTARKLWYSSRTWPLRGWHVQQLRRIAIAHYIQHDGLLYCDSDMLFIRPFSTQSLWQDGDLRLYCKANGIDDDVLEDSTLHKAWTRHAAHLFRLKEPQFPANDYINNLVSWRRADVLAMCDRLEQLNGKHWLSSIASSRSFSECQIYGAYVQGVLEGKGHWQTAQPLCETYWFGKELDRAALEKMVEEMKPYQVAVGIQSFTNTDPNILRSLLAA